MVVHHLFVVDAQSFQLLLGRLATGFDPEQPFLLQVDPVLVFVARETPPMDVEVRVLVLPLVLALEPFQVFNMLLLEPELEVLELLNFLLIVVDGLPHALLFVLDHEQFHFDRLLDV